MVPTSENTCVLRLETIVMHTLWVLALELGLREGELLGLR